MNWYKRAVISPETARALKIKKNLPIDENFENAVNGTEGANITEDGLEIEVTRNQHPDQSDQPALRSGVFYQPTGSKSKYPYSGKGGYGGTEKIKGTTLFKNPMFVKGATGGKAPTMAYDLIKGKGSYQKMRDEVVRVAMTLISHTHNANDSWALIENLLIKFDGDVDLTGNIEDFQKTAKGNNFAYAMQENIVANVVRKAGYDGIIGWSKRRDGTTFISEVFDVRESTYPSQWKPEGNVHHTLL
jgi:hypothetical protein